MADQADIRDIHFSSLQPTDFEFEILSLKSLFNRKLDHSLEQPQRTHFYLIIFFTHGTGTHYIDFTPYTYDSGTILFIAQGQIQKFVVNAEADGFLILFTSNFLYHNATEQNILRSLQVFDYALHSPKIALQPSQRADVLKLCNDIEREYSHFSDPLTAEMLRTLLRLLLLHVERIRRTSEHSVVFASFYQDFVTFRDLVERDFTRSRTVQYFAQQLAVSPKQLNKITRQVVNKTAKAFIDERVVLEARRLLAQNRLSVKQIAYHLGFDEPTNFVKFFKKHAACNPSDFRKHQPVLSRSSVSP